MCVYRLLVFSVMEAGSSETSVLIQQYTRCYPATDVVTLQALVRSELDWLTLKLGPTVGPETSARNYHSTLCEIPEQRRSCKSFFFLWHNSPTAGLGHLAVQVSGSHTIRRARTQSYKRTPGRTYSERVSRSSQRALPT